MAAPPQTHVFFHDSVKKFIDDNRNHPKFNHVVVLSYGMAGDIPWARLEVGPMEAQVPVPVSPGPYKNWMNWFKEFLEKQIWVLCQETECVGKRRLLNKELVDLKEFENGNIDKY